MKVNIHDVSQQGLLVTLQIYPMPASQQLHDCVLTKHYRDGTRKMQRNVLETRNEVADLLFAIYAPEEIEPIKYIRSSIVRMINRDYGLFLHDKET
jgi:hypothetical protein